MLSDLDEDALAVIRQRDMGFVFQSFHLLPTLTVAENIAFPLDIARRPNQARVDELIEAVDLGHRRNSLPNQLSGGEQQRTAVARALVSRPRYAADEPTGTSMSKMPIKSCSCYWTYASRLARHWWW